MASKKEIEKEVNSPVKQKKKWKSKRGYTASELVFGSLFVAGISAAFIGGVTSITLFTLDKVHTAQLKDCLTEEHAEFNKYLCEFSGRNLNLVRLYALSNNEKETKLIFDMYETTEDGEHLLTSYLTVPNSTFEEIQECSRAFSCVDDKIMVKFMRDRRRILNKEAENDKQRIKRLFEILKDSIEQERKALLPTYYVNVQKEYQTEDLAHYLSESTQSDIVMNLDL